ncbi:MAG TPA: beta-galactosidase, partial [Thermomicrobiales bacterium]|nr:beta-galactosidase [Thermomicrobiales bacterium]
MAWRNHRADLSRFLVALIYLVAGAGLGTTGALLDNYLHRGVETGAGTPYVVQPTGKELATNLDLRLFPDSEYDNVSQELNQSGFRYVRQVFSWGQIEPNQGDYQWAAYDAIVKSLSTHGVKIIAVIEQTPQWATGGSLVQANDRPPSDPKTMQTFMQALTKHYAADGQQDIPFVQIWDKPNLASQWGGSPGSGASFLPFLAAAYNGALAGDAEVKVITPELAMTSDDPLGESDLSFLRDLLSAGGGSFADIYGMQLDGGSYSPDDRRVDVSRDNFSRAILYRDLLVDMGEADKPVWATSYGWAAQGSVSRDLQGQYVVRGLNRSWSEWPWMGLMVQWSFIDPDANAPDAKYAVVLPSGRGTPLYTQLTEDAVQQRSKIANTGFAPMDSQSVSYSGNWQDQHLEGRTFRTTSESESTATLTFRGTGLIAYIRTGPQSGDVKIELDGKVVSGGGGSDGTDWTFYDQFGTNDYPHTLLSGLSDTTHTVTITLTGEGELTIGGL